MLDQNINHQFFFDEQSKTWEKNQTAENIQRLEKIFSAFTFNFGSKILDVGCGTGILVPILTKSQKKYLIEYDISKKMLLKNREKWHILSIIKQLNGEAERLPLKNDCFSTIICFAVLPHIADKHAAYQEFYRVLRAGGHLIILHLMGSQQLNQCHKDLGAAVAHDFLCPVSSVVNKLKEFGFTPDRYQEKDDLYLIVVKK